MSKEWFKHDFNASADLKMGLVRGKYGMRGVGIYWSLVELMYSSDGWLNLSKEIHWRGVEQFLGESSLQEVVTFFVEVELFEVKEGKYTSLRVQQQLAERAEKSGIYRKNREQRQKKEEQTATIALQLYNNCTTKLTEREREREGELDKNLASNPLTPLQGETVESPEPKKPKKQKRELVTCDSPLPEHLDTAPVREALALYLESRRQNGHKPWTEFALKLACQEFIDPKRFASALDNSARRGWMKLVEPPGTSFQAGGRPARETAQERQQRQWAILDGSQQRGSESSKAVFESRDGSVQVLRGDGSDGPTVDKPPR